MSTSRNIETGMTDQRIDLERIYAIDDHSAAIPFIERNCLQDLLVEAESPLRNAFGSWGAIKSLRLVRDDEGIDTLFCIVQFRGDVETGIQALASFDEQWWLQRSPSVAGKLNFDFEFV